MSTIERFVPYVTLRTFSDPTADEAIGHIDRVDTRHLTNVRQMLQELNIRRRLGSVTKKEFTHLRAPLVAAYKESLQIHIARRIK